MCSRGPSNQIGRRTPFSWLFSFFFATNPLLQVLSVCLRVAGFTAFIFSWLDDISLMFVCLLPARIMIGEEGVIEMYEDFAEEYDDTVCGEKTCAKLVCVCVCLSILQRTCRQCESVLSDHERIPLVCVCCAMCVCLLGSEGVSIHRTRANPLLDPHTPPSHRGCQ